MENSKTVIGYAAGKGICYASDWQELFELTGKIQSSATTYVYNVDKNNDFRPKELHHKPWLIQRGLTKDIDRNDTNSLDELIKWDYMGAAEFEWGAIPRSISRFSMYLKMNTLIIHSTKLNDRDFYFLSPIRPELMSEYMKWFELESHGDIQYFKEITRLYHASKGMEDRTNFWWDIDFDTMMSFDRQFLEDIQNKYLQNTIDRFISNLNNK